MSSQESFNYVHVVLKRTTFTSHSEKCVRFPMLPAGLTVIILKAAIVLVVLNLFTTLVVAALQCLTNDIGTRA